MQILPPYRDFFFDQSQNVCKDNYDVLMSRGKCVHYKVENERLVPLSVWENIKYFFSKSYHDQIQRDVKRSVEQVFTNMRYVENLPQMEEVFLKVRNFSKNLFDREVIKRNQALFEPLRDRIIDQMRASYSTSEEGKKVTNDFRYLKRRVIGSQAAPLDSSASAAASSAAGLPPQRVGSDSSLSSVPTSDSELVDSYDPQVDDDERKFWHLMGEAQIATWAFSSFKRNGGGTSGNYRIQDLSGKTVGIFKPVSESPHGPLNPYFSIRVRNFIQVCLGWTKDRVVVEERGHVREQFASIVAKELSLINDVTRQTLVPMARVVQMKSRDLQNKESWQPGSVQFFIDKAKDGFTHFQVPEWTIFNTMESYLPKTDKAIAKKMDEGDFQRIVVLDYLLGNIDFNLGNILFVKRDRSGNGSALGIAARDSSSVHQSPKPLSAHSIDYWFSMPKAHPVKWLDKRNMHRWKALPYAEQHVMASIKTRVRDVWEEIAWQAQRFFSDDKMTKVIVDEGGAPRTITVTAIECLNHRKRALLERGDALKTLIPDPADWFVKANRALTV